MRRDTIALVTTVTTTDVAEPDDVSVARAESAQVRGLAGDHLDLVEMSRGLVAYNVGYLVLTWGILIGAISLFWVEPAWYTFALAFVVVSSRQQALLNCEHECVHRKFVPSRRFNDLFGMFLCAGPVGSPFSAAQARHLAHHRLLTTPGDPDRHLHNGEPPKDTRWGLVKYFVNGLLGGYAVMVLLGPQDRPTQPSKGSARRDVLALLVSQTVIAGGLTLAFTWWVYPALWLLPLASVTALCHLVRSFVEHAVTDDEMGRHHNRLITIRSNFLERGLVSPYFMNYHAEHHLMPSVPAPRLRKLQARLAGRQDLPPVLERRSYGSAVGRYVRALRG